MSSGFNNKNGKQKGSSKHSKKNNFNRPKSNLKTFIEKHYKIIGIVLPLLSIAITLLGVIIGQGGIKDWISAGSKNPACISAQFDASQYQYAENAFFKEFLAKKVEIPSSLWQPNGMPIPLGEMLIYQSQDLRNLRDAIINQRRFGKTNQLVFIYGSAGVGKSSVVSDLRNIKPVVVVVDIARLAYNSLENKEHPMTKLITDLKISDIEVSKMADLKESEKKKNFIRLLSDIAEKDISKSQSIIVDGLDEIHPNASLHILSLARNYIKENPQKNIIFFGRGEGFRNYIDKYEDAAFLYAIYLQPIYLNTPELTRWYIAQQLTYAYRKENPNYSPNLEELEKETERKVSQLENRIQKNPALRSYLQTAYPANMLLKNLRYDDDINKLNELLFSDLIDRNRKTHNRPSNKNPEVWPLYEQALREAARMLKLEKRPDGTFTAIVKPTEVINVKYNDKCYSVGLAELLNRSGIANLNPFNQKQLEYTFQPLTIQKFLANGSQ
jgi:hypothetical protein